MKKTYMAPQMECGLMGDLLPLCVSGVTGDGVIEGCPRCESEDWVTRRVLEDGKTRIYLSVRPGFKLILR